MEVGSLFSGIGGIELGFERAGFKTKWMVEKNEYAREILKKNFPTTSIFEDVTKIDWHSIDPVDVLTGGFPCQDISRAGRMRGLEGKKSGLWAYFKDAIRIIRPKYVLVENVPMLRFKGLGRVLGALAKMGYDAEWTSLWACQFGAPHARERLFVVAYHSCGRHKLQKKPILAGRTPTELCNWWKNQPAVCRVDDGVPHRVDRLKCLGNSVVPQVAEFVANQIGNNPDFLTTLH